MTAAINIGNLHIRATLRHRFEKHEDDRWWDRYTWREWELGLWFKKYKAVAKKGFKDVSKWGPNLANVYTVGLNLLVVKAWIDIDYGVMHIKEK